MAKPRVIETRECPYHAYYHDQVGSGVSNVYLGYPYQRGHGLGSMLGSLWRWATSLQKKGAKVIGKILMNVGTRVGSQVLSDVAQGTKVKDSLKRQIEEEVDQAGTGVKRVRKSGKRVIRKRARNRVGPPDRFFTA